MDAALVFFVGLRLCAEFLFVNKFYDNFCKNFVGQKKMKESKVRAALSQCIKTIVKEDSIKEAMRVSGLGYKAVWSILEDKEGNK